MHFLFLAFTCSQARYHSLCYCTFQCLSSAFIEMAWTSLFWKPWQVNTPTWHTDSLPSQQQCGLHFSLSRVFALRDRFEIQMTTPARTRAQLSWVCTQTVDSVCTRKRSTVGCHIEQAGTLNADSTPSQHSISRSTSPSRVIETFLWNALFAVLLRFSWGRYSDRHFSSVSAQSEPSFFSLLQKLCPSKSKGWAGWLAVV